MKRCVFRVHSEKPYRYHRCLIFIDIRVIYLVKNLKSNVI